MTVNEYSLMIEGYLYLTPSGYIVVAISAELFPECIEISVKQLISLI